MAFSSSSSSSIRITCSSLAEDILIEIFTRLPLISIYRFKSVSKVWLSILSNPNFIAKWFQLNNKSLPWIHYHTITDPTPLKFRYAYPELHSQFITRNEYGFSFKFLLKEIPSQRAYLFLLCSSNGLVLCYSVNSWTEVTPKRYFVCNPLTRKWVSIPSHPRCQADGLEVNGIFCESSLSSTTCCYKVVCIPRFGRPSKKFNVGMFCSDLGVWKGFQVSCDENVVWWRCQSENVVTVDGVLYWIEGGNRMLVYSLNQNGNGHRCSLIKLPDAEFGDYAFGCWNTRNLGESEGCVCYARTRNTGRKITVSVWVLDEVNWQILHMDVSVDCILDEPRSRAFEVLAIQVLGFSPVDQNVVLLGNNHWVWEFNIQTRSFQELCNSSPSGDRRFPNLGNVLVPFVLKPMPTSLPSPSWMDT